MFLAIDHSHHLAVWWYLPLNIFFACLGFASYSRMWLMKRWGVLLYSAMFVISLIMLQIAHTLNPVRLIPSVLTLIIGFAYFAYMD